MISWPNFVSQLFNGVALGALLALISSGLTIIYGTLGVLNLAHGAMFMIGGYAGFVAYQYTGSFTIAVIAGSLFVMLLGLLMERVIIRHFYQRPHEDQDRKSTRLNSSHPSISYAVFCLKKKTTL